MFTRAARLRSILKSTGSAITNIKTWKWVSVCVVKNLFPNCPELLMLSDRSWESQETFWFCAFIEMIPSERKKKKHLQPCQGQSTIRLRSHDSDKVVTGSWSIRVADVFRILQWLTNCTLGSLVRCYLCCVADADPAGRSHSCVCSTPELSVRYESQQVLDKTHPKVWFRC